MPEPWRKGDFRGHMRKKKKKKTDWEKGLGMTSVAVSGASVSPGYEGYLRMS